MKTVNNYFTRYTWIPVFLVLVIYYWFSQKINFAEGYGWDGAMYGLRATDFWPIFKAKLITPNAMVRLLPSASIYFFFRFLRIPYTHSNVIHAFCFLDASAITLAYVYFQRLAVIFKLRSEQTLFAFCAIFISYFTLKFIPYYPVLTDASGLCLGLATCYYFYAKKPFMVALALLATAFVWPSGLVSGFFLLIFPLNSSFSVKNQKTAHILSNAAWLAIFIGFFFLLNRLQIQTRTESPGGVVIDRSVLFLSASALLFYLLKIATYLMQTWFHPETTGDKNPFRLIDVRGVCLVLAVMSIQFAVIKRGCGVPGTASALDTLCDFFDEALVDPAHFLVAHFVFWGPLFCVLFLGIPRIFKSLQSDGIGIQCFAVLTLFFMMDAESRHHVFHLPILFLILARTLNLNFSVIGSSLFVVMQLLVSRFWLSFDFDWTAPRINFLAFPWQLYWMNFGEFMAKPVYLVAGVLMLACISGLLLYQLKRPSIFRD